MDKLAGERRGFVWRSGVTGALVGAALTLAMLYVIGVPLYPGLNSPAFRKFVAAYDDLTQKYYKPVSNQTLLDGAISGMVNALGDRFTEYFTPKEAQQFQSMLSGSFDGIGVVIRSVAGRLTILSVNPGSPAEKAGLRAKDVIVAVNGKSVAGLPIDQVSQLIVGPRGTTVTLTIERPSQGNRRLQIPVVRGPVVAPSVSSKMLTGAPWYIGYLQISVVGQHTASEVQSALSRLKQQGAKRLIVDLRGNGGGYLQQAVDIAGDFIPKGKVVVQTQGRTGAPQPLLSPGPGIGLPIVVLVDKDTASAAEILAAALHADTGAPLVGTQTYGKGTVQETDLYRDGSGLKYTVARWLTPDGQWINGRGLTPTVRVDLPPLYTLPPIDTKALPLRPGDHNATVGVLQRTLQALGHHVGRTDGYYDASTAAAVRQVQQSAHLPLTGVFDQATCDALQAEIDIKLDQSDTQLQKAEQLVEQLAPGK